MSPGRARGWLFDMLVTIFVYDLPGDKVSGFPRCSDASRAWPVPLHTAIEISLAVWLRDRVVIGSF